MIADRCGDKRDQRTSGLRVTVISPLGYTGLAYYDFSLCESLSERGAKVTLFTSDSWILKEKSRRFGVEYVYQRCSGSQNPLLKGLNYIVSSARLVAKLLGSRPHVVHMQILQFPVIDLLVLSALKIAGFKAVFTPHELLLKKRLPLSFFSTRCVHKVCDRIVMHNFKNRDELMELFSVPEHKISVIPHGNYNYFVPSDVDSGAARALLQIPQDCKSFLFFGTLRSNKGLVPLLDSLNLLKKETHKFRLLIAGKPWEITQEYLSKLITEKELEDNVILKLGFLSDKEVDMVFGASDVVVLPYERIYESGVLKLAQSYGKLVLCSDLPELKEQVIDGETGLLFLNGNPHDLFLKLKDLIDNPKHDDLGSRTRRYVTENFSWDEIAKRTLDLYQSVWQTNRT